MSMTNCQRDRDRVLPKSLFRFDRHGLTGPKSRLMLLQGEEEIRKSSVIESSDGATSRRWYTRGKSLVVRRDLRTFMSISRMDSGRAPFVYRGFV
jgi:hypothetical protein